jgi:V-type H+-transporting ATPase 16kDa proteolipid subunit
MISTIMAAAADDSVPHESYFFGFMGVACALVFANIGSAYGCAKSGLGISYYGVIRSEGIIKAIIPVIMAGILGIYGLVVAVLLIQQGKISIV